jgi:hypothetical protein
MRFQKNFRGETPDVSSTRETASNAAGEGNVYNAGVVGREGKGWGRVERRENSLMVSRTLSHVPSLIACLNRPSDKLTNEFLS